MIIEFGFQAKDYQEIDKIENNWISPKEYEDRIQKNSKLSKEILKFFLNMCNEKLINRKSQNEGRIFIGRGQEREYEKIELFAEMDPNKLNGIVGVLSGEIVLKDIEEGQWKKWMEEFDQGDVLKINLQIKSRFDLADSYYFISYLLSDQMVDTNNYVVYENWEDIFNFLLVDLLCNKLKEACVKGYYRKYSRIEGNDEKVRGSIDISRHIRMNMGQNNGKIAYTFRENSVKNPLNELIVVAYNCLKTKYPSLVEEKLDNDLEIAEFFAEIKKNIYEYSPFNKLIMDNLRPIAHPYFQEYEMVRVICLQILKDEGVSLYNATSDEVNGFLYYLPDLWEEFLERIFKDMDLEKNINMKMESQKKVVYMGRECRPDFVFSADNVDVLVLDAKMKPSWGKELRKGTNITEREKNDIDKYKCVRDMNAVGALKTGVIFPMNVGKKEDIYGTLVKIDISEFYRLPLGVPEYEEKDTYIAWKQEFLKSIEGFKQCVKKVLKEAKEDKDIIFLKNQLLEMKKKGEKDRIQYLKEIVEGWRR